MKKVASIDIGTNSMRLLVADIDKENRIIEGTRDKETKITRIGKGVDESRLIQVDAFNYNLESFNNFVNEAKKKEVDYIFAIGTSALRDAKNGKDFVKSAKDTSGVEIQIISGELEAELGFYGVSQDLNEEGRILIIDIGGGSTELIVGSHKEGIIFRESIDIGAVRLSEKFRDNYIELNKYIKEMLQQYEGIITTYNINKVVGIGGTITTLSSINQSLEIYDSNKIHKSKLDILDVEKIYEKIKNLSKEELLELKGLQKERADIIVYGVSILVGIMHILKIMEIVVSEYDNLEGAIYHYLRLINENN